MQNLLNVFVAEANSARGQSEWSWKLLLVMHSSYCTCIKFSGLYRCMTTFCYTLIDKDDDYEEDEEEDDDDNEEEDEEEEDWEEEDDDDDYDDDDDEEEEEVVVDVPVAKRLRSQQYSEGI